MSSRRIRMWTAACLVGFLFVFCVPFLPYMENSYVVCLAPRGGGCPMEIRQGYQSLGRLFTTWGAVYFPSRVTFELGNNVRTLNNLAELFIVVLPTLAAVAWLLSSELLKRRAPGAGFGAFGVLLLTVGSLQLLLGCAFLYLMWLSGGTSWVLLVLTPFYGASGTLMVLRAMQLRSFGVWNG